MLTACTILVNKWQRLWENRAQHSHKGGGPDAYDFLIRNVFCKFLYNIILKGILCLPCSPGMTSPPVLLFRLLSVSTGLIVAALYPFSPHATERSRVPFGTSLPEGINVNQLCVTVTSHRTTQTFHLDCGTKCHPGHREIVFSTIGLAKLPCPCWNPLCHPKGCSSILTSRVLQKAAWSDTFRFGK